jgi:hypothetical protein
MFDQMWIVTFSNPKWHYTLYINKSEKKVNEEDEKINFKCTKSKVDKISNHQNNPRILAQIDSIKGEWMNEKERNTYYSNNAPRGHTENSDSVLAVHIDIHPKQIQLNSNSDIRSSIFSKVKWNSETR